MITILILISSCKNISIEDSELEDFSCQNSEVITGIESDGTVTCTECEWVQPSQDFEIAVCIPKEE